MTRKINTDIETYTDEQQRLKATFEQNKYEIKPNDSLLLRKIEMDRKQAEFKEKSKNFVVQIIS